MIVNQLERHCIIHSNLDDVETLLNGIAALSTIWAVTGVTILFKIIYKDISELDPTIKLAKQFGFIKVSVFIVTFQRMILNGIASSGRLHFQSISPTDPVNGLLSILIVIEMWIMSVWQMYAFPHQRYCIEGEPPTCPNRGFADLFKLEDWIHDLGICFKTLRAKKLEEILPESDAWRLESQSTLVEVAH